MFMFPVNDQFSVGCVMGVKLTPLPMDQEPLMGWLRDGFDGIASDPGT